MRKLAMLVLALGVTSCAPKQDVVQEHPNQVTVEDAYSLSALPVETINSLLTDIEDAHFAPIKKYWTKGFKSDDYVFKARAYNNELKGYVNFTYDSQAKTLETVLGGIGEDQSKLSIIETNIDGVPEMVYFVDGGIRKTLLSDYKTDVSVRKEIDSLYRQILKTPLKK